jgi:uncharacterized LabA/DUF88 family protein
VTTEYMHHEHSDVDTSVAEYPSALETTTNPTANETATSVEAHDGEVGVPSSELAAPAPISEEDQKSSDTEEVLSDLAHAIVAPPETVSPSGPFLDNQDVLEEPLACSIAEESASSAVEESASSAVKEEQQTQEAINILEVPVSADTLSASTSGVVQVEDSKSVTIQEELVQLSSQEQVSQEQLETELIPDVPSLQLEAAVPTDLDSPFISTETENKPLLGAKTEEIRPFTDFIEEFRLAEAARLQTTLHESQVDAFVLLNSVESVFAASASLTDPRSSVEEEISDGRMQSEQSTSTMSGPITTNEAPTPKSDQNNELVTSTDRAVSPLLRPATRLRVPRHGAGRHHREEQASPAEIPAPVQSETAQTIPSEPPVVTTPPKPARRYRFDRPSSSTIVSTSSANGAYGVNSSVQAASKLTTGQTFSEETRSGVTPMVDLAMIGEQAVSEATQSIGLPVHKLPATQTTASAETPVETITSPSEQGRRRQSQKEQPVAASPVTQVEAAPIPELASTIEPSVLPQEAAPEDLPPLEYSELQKAHPRRRRRHRSGSNSNTPVSPAASTTPVTSSVPPTPQQPPRVIPQIPPTPVQPVVSPPPTYSIVSGYTVNQMNQGNDTAGPFLGPEPAPARGSVFTRDGRSTTRSASQRASVSPSTPANRASDNGLTTASINQFATIVSQAIETQTDRMVAEFRRLSQAPTNVSVSLPPFPSSERVGVFVDVANLLYSARTLRIAVDFGKLLDFLRGNRRLIRAHAYCPTSPQPGDEQMFLQAVKGLGYRITTKNYKTFSSGAKKADLDLDLCMDVVRLVDGKAVDCIVLLSGDSDFMPMLDYCSDHGVRVEVAAFDEAMSATLRQGCDLFINLSMLEEIRA